MTQEELNCIAGECRLAFGHQANAFNDGVDAMLRAVSIAQAQAAPEPFNKVDWIVAQHLKSKEPKYTRVVDGVPCMTVTEHDSILAAQSAERCKYCDDTGDVHSITGDWRGRCKCKSGEYTDIVSDGGMDPRKQAQAAEPVIPDGYALVPDYRGYAHLGTGQYVLNTTDKPDPAEVIISIATEADKAGRTIGERRDNPAHSVIQPEEMCVRIRFENERGLFALEDQLADIRKQYFSDAEQPKAQAAEPVGKVLDFASNGNFLVEFSKRLPAGTMLYTTPPQHQAEMEALRKANIDCVNHFDALMEDYDKAQAAMKLALGLLKRYRNETPIGHQPHMIAHEADAAIAALEGSLK